MQNDSVETLDLDLRYWVWSSEQYDWPQDIYNRIQDAYSGKKPPVILLSHPKKECRIGKVTIQKCQISGHFATLWDGFEELAVNYNIPDHDQDTRLEFEAAIPSHEAGYGCSRSFVVADVDFGAALKLVDQEELRLIADDDNAILALDDLFLNKGPSAILITRCKAIYKRLVDLNVLDEEDSKWNPQENQDPWEHLFKLITPEDMENLIGLAETSPDCLI